MHERLTAVAGRDCLGLLLLKQFVLFIVFFFFNYSLFLLSKPTVTSKFPHFGFKKILSHLVCFGFGFQKPELLISWSFQGAFFFPFDGDNVGVGVNCDF